MDKPIWLQLGASRLEFLPDDVLEHFLNDRWVHFGDAEDGSPSRIRRIVRKWRLIRRGIHDARKLYDRTRFIEWIYKKDDPLPFSDGQLNMVFSEHFFEHLFFDEAISLMRECHRVIKSGGVLRVVVPDADLRTYEKPEPVGYPHKKLSFDAPQKHKTRWSVYMLSEALKGCGFDAVPIHFCDRKGKFTKAPIRMPAFHDQTIQTLEYVRRPMSLIVDGIKP